MLETAKTVLIQISLQKVPTKKCGGFAPLASINGRHKSKNVPLEDRAVLFVEEKSKGKSNLNRYNKN